MVKAKILRSAEVLFSLRSFFATRPASSPPSRSEFHAFVSAALDRQPEVLGLEWVPRVLHDDRDRLEKAARVEGFLNFQFTQKDEGNRLTRDSERAEYLPVYYLEPSDRNLRAAGYDMLSSESRRTAFERARDTGDLTATAPVLLAQEVGSSAAGFLVGLPIYMSGDAPPPTTIAGRREALEGFALAVFKVRDLVDPSLSLLAAAGVNVELRDVESGNSIYVLAADIRESPSSFAGPLHPPVGGIAETFPIDIAGRHWRLLLRTTPAFAATRYSWQSWSAPFLCLLLTSGLGGYLLTIARHTAFIESRVARRTSQLSEEIQERSARSLRPNLRSGNSDRFLKTRSKGSFRQPSTAITSRPTMLLPRCTVTAIRRN